MTEIETRKILAYLYAEIGKPLAESKVKIWAELLKPVPFMLGMEAAREMLKVKTYGEPQFSDYRLIVNRLHRAARRSARGVVGIDYAALSQMNPGERDAFIDAQKMAQRIPRDKAVAMLAEIDRKRLSA